MYPTFTDQIARQRIVELHQQAARQRLVRALRTAAEVPGQRHRSRVRLPLRHSRPVAA